MSKKFYLIPSDQYSHMLNSLPLLKEPNLTDTDPLINFTKKEMKKILKDKRINNSTKSALYNQELVRFLNQRKEKMNRPIKVEVVNKGGVKAAILPQTELEPDNIKEPEGLVGAHVIPQKEEPRLVEPQAEQENESPSKKRAKIISKIPLNKIWDLESAVFKKRNELGINDQGQILGNNSRPILGSNYKDVVRYLINPENVKHDISGMSRLKLKLIDDPELYSLIESVRKEIVASRPRGVKRPRRNLGVASIKKVTPYDFVVPQEGEGIQIKEKSFKPSLWK